MILLNVTHFLHLALKMANPLDELRDITLTDLIIKLDLSEDEFDDEDHAFFYFWSHVVEQYPVN